MTTETKPIETHDVHSRRLIRHARQQLEKGDRLQASEKAWGAVAHRVKAIANRMGWTYELHSDFIELQDRIAHLTADPRKTKRILKIALHLHTNYYRDRYPLDSLREDIEDVEELLDILDWPQFRQTKRTGQRPRRRGAGSEIGGMGRPIATPRKHQAKRSRTREDTLPSQASLDSGKR